MHFDVDPGHRTIAHDDRGEGAPLVLLHGHPFDRSMWAPQLEALSEEFRIVAIDLPGYGESSVRSDPMTMRAFADAVIEVLDRLAIQRATVVGLSMGGLVAMEMGLGYPDRIAGLVLAATTAQPLALGERQTRRDKADLAQAVGMLPLAAEMIADLFGPSGARDQNLVLRIFAMMLSTSPDGAAAALRGRADRPDYSSLLRSLTVPSLVIAGDHDVHSPPAVIDQLIDALPQPQLVRFADSGHLPNLEEPGHFNDAVRTFAHALEQSD